MKSAVAIHFSSEDQETETPAEAFGFLDDAFGFTLDVCALSSNAKCRRYFTPHDNGLAQSWAPHQCFMNPRYDQLPQWMAKARHQATCGASTVCLLPMRPDEWWHRFVLQSDGAAGRLRRSFYCERSQVFWCAWEELTVGIYHWPGRIEFQGKGSGAPFPSVVVVLDPPRFRQRFRRRRARAPGDGGRYPLTWSRP